MPPATASSRWPRAATGSCHQRARPGGRRGPGDRHPQCPDDGRTQAITREETAADRLTHGYAVTVHLAPKRQAQRDLEPGWARYPSTPEGEAARALTDARYRRRQAEEFTRTEGMDRHNRRDWKRSA